MIIDIRTRTPTSTSIEAFDSRRRDKFTFASNFNMNASAFDAARTVAVFFQ
jgi:hypothetical protein